MASAEYSLDGNHFALIDTDGKLKIWDTSTSVLKQEYVPNLHLSHPCTCLHWIQTLNTQNKKRKRNEDAKNKTQLLALGTTSGSIILYSPTEGAVRNTLKSDHSYKQINCLSWVQNLGLVTCGKDTAIHWNLNNGTIKSSWKVASENENVSCALFLPDKARLLTAARTIKLWDIAEQKLLKTYTGHTSEVCFMKYVSSSNNPEGYFISGAKVDRILSCWNLNEKSKDKTSVANFIMEDCPKHISVTVNESGAMNMAAVTRSGVVHVYQQILNGKCDKPLKPCTTLQVASDTGQTREVVTPIPVLAAHINEDNSILIGYGAQHIIVFERVIPSTYEKIQCLVRIDPRKIITKESVMSNKTKTPKEENVDYLTPNNSTSTVPVKRKITGEKVEVTMEERLENLVLNKPETSGGVPKSDNVANLLIQGLTSKDRTLLQNVFQNKSDTVIRNTIKRLPMQAITVLFKELNNMIQGKTAMCQTGTIWLKYLIRYHASQLISNSELSNLSEPTLGIIENRISLLTPLSRLTGRLDLLVSQISQSNEEIEDFHQISMIYQDTDSSSSDSDENLDIAEVSSDSDDQWEENSTNEGSESDIEVVDMSSS